MAIYTDLFLQESQGGRHLVRKAEHLQSRVLLHSGETEKDKQTHVLNERTFIFI